MKRRKKLPAATRYQAPAAKGRNSLKKEAELYGGGPNIEVAALDEKSTPFWNC